MAPIAPPAKEGQGVPSANESVAADAVAQVVAKLGRRFGVAGQARAPDPRNGASAFKMLPAAALRW